MMRGPRRRLSTLERRDLNTKGASLLEAAMVRPLDAGIRTADVTPDGANAVSTTERGDAVRSQLASQLAGE
jgi:hypothetical protein